MDRSADLVAAERGDDALNLPPVTELQDIAAVPAALRPHRRFEAGVLAEAINQVMRVEQRRAPGDEKAIHAPALPDPRLHSHPTDSVNNLFTITALASAAGLWQSAPMSRRSPQAGGFLLILAIFIGMAAGIMAGQPVLGVLAGTGIGILLALAVWLVDRRRR